MKNESLRQAKFDVSPRARATRKHRESLWGKTDRGDFRAVIDCLVPPPARAADLVALFDNRATHGAIQNWRFRGSAPAWAIELACQKLHSHLDKAYQAIQRAPQYIGPGSKGSGAAGAKALAAWRERKARERDEKEKAAHEAALKAWRCNSDLDEKEKAAHDEREKAIWQQRAKTKWASEDGTTQGRDDD